MSVVTIIGAGAMGSALTTPLVENGHDVRLWGTELDGTIVDALKEGKDHPKHKYPLRKETKVFYEQELKQAMEGHDAVIMAITSDALAKIFKRIVPHLSREALVVTVSKGFDYDSEGKVILLPDLLKGILQENDKAGVPIVAVGGPCKANEVLYRSPSCVTYAGENSEAVKKAKGLLQTEVYNVQADGDVIGTEVAAATKKAPAISLWIGG
ncbi:MAG TPA: glycerol-3-phosphate dehydrogenase, partial [Eubacteriaceae bacterium]|nr:glycerol-3-phosphate dehydrogenase [Eubacteriaceae bacterium]